MCRVCVTHEGMYALVWGKTVCEPVAELSVVKGPVHTASITDMFADGEFAPGLANKCTIHRFGTCRGEARNFVACDGSEAIAKLSAAWNSAWLLFGAEYCSDITGDGPASKAAKMRKRMHHLVSTVQGIGAGKSTSPTEVADLLKQVITLAKLTLSTD
eukprot:10342903-Karenia_brevis.AAC.1